jgi:hypothetical protein
MFAETCKSNSAMNSTSAALLMAADEFESGFRFNNGLENRARDIGFRVAQTP